MSKFLKFVSSSTMSGLISTIWWIWAWYMYSVMKLPMNDWIFAMFTAILFAVYALKKDDE